jgi:ABC-type nitrate/sulfonate/bicarbonate transport system permease component
VDEVHFLHHRVWMVVGCAHLLSAERSSRPPGVRGKRRRPVEGGAGTGLRRAIPFLVAFVLLAIWQLLTMFHLFSAVVLPSPLAVVQEIPVLFTTGYGGQTLLTDIWISTARIGVGFLAAVVIGVPIGILMASSDLVFQVIDPLLQFVRPVPPLAYIPLLVFWFGIGEISKGLLILLGTIPVIIINAISGVRSTPPERIRVAQCVGATRMQILRHVVLPSAMPEIFTGMRVGIGVAWTCLVAAEIIAANAGLGWLVQTAGNEVQIGIVFVAITAIGLIGYAMELVIRLFERAAVPWKGRA